MSAAREPNIRGRGPCLGRRSRARRSALWVIEVVSPESAHRDRTVKLRKYAEAGIPRHRCVEGEDGSLVVHVHELDGPTRAYAPAGTFRDALKRPAPLEISLDLGKLTPPRAG